MEELKFSEADKEFVTLIKAAIDMANNLSEDIEQGGQVSTHTETALETFSEAFERLDKLIFQDNSELQ